MSIRTTVTLDEDVWERVKQESRARGTSFRDELNDLVRRGLVASKSKPVRRSFHVKPTHMGYRPGLNYDNVESLIEFGEGENHR